MTDQIRCIRCGQWVEPLAIENHNKNECKPITLLRPDIISFGQSLTGLDRHSIEDKFKKWIEKNAVEKIN